MSEPIEVIHPVLLIRISQLYRDGMSGRELYDATRGVWKVGPRRAEARYGLAVHEGIVREVFEIQHWLPAGSTEYVSRSVTPTSHPGRWEFVGDLASNEIRERYIGGSVSHYFPRGAQNPVMYVNVPESEDQDR